MQLDSKMFRLELEIPMKWKTKIAKELNTTTQTVRMSLAYVNNSPLAHQIRKSALCMMQSHINMHEKYNE